MEESSAPGGLSPRDDSFAIVGAGRVGVTLGAALAKAGRNVVACVFRSDASKKRAAAWLDCPLFDDPVDAAARAGTVILSVPDSEVSPLARLLADRDAVRTDSFVAHTAGALGREPLSPLSRTGARTLVLHPLQSIPSVEQGLRRLPGSWFGVTCEDDVKPWATALVSDLGGKVLWVPESKRAAYHAAAAVSSNYLVLLAALAEEIFGELEPYLPLMRGTLENVEQIGARNALTGPVARGDYGTVAQHLEVLTHQSDHLADVYRRLATETLRYAERWEIVPPAAAETIREVIGP